MPTIATFKQNSYPQPQKSGLHKHMSAEELGNKDLSSDATVDAAPKRKKGLDALFQGHVKDKTSAETDERRARKEKTLVAAASVAAYVKGNLTGSSSKQPNEEERDAFASGKQTEAKDERMNFETDIVEHRLSSKDLAERYSTCFDLRHPLKSQGLSPSKAAHLLDVHGENALSPPRKSPWYWKFLSCLGNLFNVLLGAAGIGYLVIYAINPVDYFENVYIGCILIGVAFVNAGIEFYELQKIAAILASFTSLIPARAEVIRGGVLNTVFAKELVPGGECLTNQPI